MFVAQVFFICIFLHSLEESVPKIVDNAGLGGLNVVNYLKRVESNMGFDAAEDEWVNMEDAGILDSTKVTCYAFQNAACCKLSAQYNKKRQLF